MVESETKESLDSLLRRNLPWIHARVRRRLGPRLRRKEETFDIVQDAVLQFLEYGPQVVISNENQFRALMARIAENVLRDRNDWFSAQRRALSRERPLPSDTFLVIDPPRKEQTTPSRFADRHEREGWIRLGIELLDDEDRQLIVFREWQHLSFRGIGERIGITEDAARMRYRATLCRLSSRVAALRRGEIGSLLDQDRSREPESTLGT
jgi:RNA polymerase sigma-70 factor, ECF subfamily